MRERGGEGERNRGSEREPYIEIELAEGRSRSVREG